MFNEPVSTVIIGEAVAGESTRVRTQLETLIKNVERSKFDIGELLHKIKRNGYYNGWGFTTFAEYAATLSIKPRTAQYLRKMAEVMDAVGVTRERYEPIGIAKLREITSLDPEKTWTNPETNETIPLKDFIVGLVDKAAEMSLEEIQQHVRTLKGFVGDDDLVFLNVSMKRSALDSTVRPALQLAKQNIGTVGRDDEGTAQDASDGAALEVIAADFMSDPANNWTPEA